MTDNTIILTDYANENLKRLSPSYNVTDHCRLTDARLVFDSLREFADGGGAVLIAAHEPAIADFADRILHIKSGHLTESKAGV